VLLVIIRTTTRITVFCGGVWLNNDPGEQIVLMLEV